MRPSRAKDIAGQRFGRLVAIRQTGHQLNGRAVWLCLCDCGAKVEVTGQNLRNGNTRSCGCLQKDYIKRVSKTLTLHGETKTRTEWARLWHYDISTIRDHIRLDADHGAKWFEARYMEWKSKQKKKTLPGMAESKE